MKHLLYDGTVELDFDEVKHVYRIGGDKVPSPSTITKVIDKPALIGWAVKVTCEYIKERLLSGPRTSESSIDALIHDAKKSRFRISKEATDIGSIAHEWIEDYINRTVADEFFHMEPPNNPNSALATQAFLDWEKENDVTWHGSEDKVYSIYHGYAGTLDGDATVNGKRLIVDFKTSKAIYSEYFLQVAAYLMAKEEETGIQYDGAVILRIDKHSGEFETRFISRDEIEEHFDTFVACLNIYHWKKTKWNK